MERTEIVIIERLQKYISLPRKYTAQIRGASSSLCAIFINFPYYIEKTVDYLRFQFHPSIYIILLFSPVFLSLALHDVAAYNKNIDITLGSSNPGSTQSGSIGGGLESSAGNQQQTAATTTTTQQSTTTTPAAAASSSGAAAATPNASSSPAAAAASVVASTTVG